MIRPVDFIITDSKIAAILKKKTNMTLISLAYDKNHKVRFKAKSKFVGSNL
jgi:hypothetical protein